MLKGTDRAYLAGLIDGEGSIGISVSKVRTPFIRIAITNTNLTSWLTLKQFGEGTCRLGGSERTAGKPARI